MDNALVNEGGKHIEIARGVRASQIQRSGIGSQYGQTCLIIMVKAHQAPVQSILFKQQVVLQRSRRLTIGALYSVTGGGIESVTVLADAPFLAGQIAVATAVRKGQGRFHGSRDLGSCLSQFLTRYLTIAVAINACQQREVT